MNKSILKSIWAVLAGFLTIVALSIGADTVLKLMGILPYDHMYVSTGLVLFVIFYRALFSLAGCYLAAKLASSNPMKHAIALGIVGIIISTAGAVVNQQMDMGPAWYAWALVVIALPVAWLGGKLYEMRVTNLQKPDYIINQ